MEKFPITVSGYEKLEHDLKRLKTEERPAVIQAIAEARAHGDLSENAEYHAAKENRAGLKARSLSWKTSLRARKSSTLRSSTAKR